MTGQSLWLDEAPPLAGGAQRLEGTVQADVCVVGGGFTGLWTAIRLKELEPSLDVALVEAETCGSGASGRNGGFVLSLWAKIATLKKLYGTEEAVRIGQASTAAVAEIGMYCEQRGIDAHYRADGWLWTATSEPQIGLWNATLATARACGVAPFTKLEPEEVARRAGSSAQLAGVFEPTAATVQPALLAHGLRRVVLEAGVQVFECSPMVALKRSPRPVVRTANGAVSSRSVVLALNAWSTRIRELRRAVVVVSSDIVATEPAPEALEGAGLRDGVAISDSRMLVNYWRATLDGRIAFGKGGGALAFRGRVGRRFEGSSPRAPETTASLRAFYPTLEEVAVPLSWTGPIDRSATGLPFFGRLGGRADIVYGVGYSGNGVGPSFLGGRVLASLALGRQDEWSSIGLTAGPVGAFPPEPVRYLGGRLVRRAVAAKEHAEDAGARAGYVTRRLASLAPTGLVPVGENAEEKEE
ncbi:MAG: FAD-dependent oxidoreductase [Actinomycetia bacterium]|nr:FAD-dependent oxidoreductase [Actinomycetes bacterium]